MTPEPPTDQARHEAQRSGEPDSHPLRCRRQNVFRSDLNGYLPLFSEVSSEFLLYGYHREARENQ